MIATHTHHVQWWDQSEVEQKRGTRRQIDLGSLGRDDDFSVVNEVIVNNGYYMRDDRSVAGRTVVDVGANIGTFAALVLNNRCRELVCVEPDPTNFGLLQENVERIGAPHARTSLMRGAAGNPMVGDTVTLSGEGENVVTQYATAETASPVMREGERRANVYAWTDVVPPGPVALVKIDCEGAEFDFLDTAPSGAFDLVDQFWIEWHTQKPMSKNVGPYVERLLYTHRIEMFGSPEHGGKLRARRYG